MNNELITNFLLNAKKNGNDLKIPTWLAMTSGAVFLFLGFLFAYFTVVYFNKHKEMLKNFDEEFGKLSSREKKNFTKQEFYNENVNMWQQNKHILFPILTLACFVLSFIFFAGHQIGIGI